MTNEQTYILLNAYRERLKAAIAEGEMLMPEDAKATRRIHKYMICFGCNKERKPDHYQDQVYSPALSPLYDLLESVEADLVLLLPKDEADTKRKAG